MTSPASVLESAYLTQLGVVTDDRILRANRLQNAFSVFVPLAGTVYGFIAWTQLAPTWVTQGIFALFFLPTAAVVGLGLHRYFTHRAFQTGRVLRFLFALFGTWAMQGPIDRWVSDHRRHHRYTDRPLDPHSPYFAEERPIASRGFGLLHSHFLWLFTGYMTEKTRYARDLVRDPMIVEFSRHYVAWCIVGLLAPALLGLALGGRDEALRCLVWAGCFRVTLLHHLTWSVNSFGHMFGSKVPGSRDEARDNRLLAALLFGEGLHSYHHRHPTVAVNQPMRLDLNGWMIKGLERLGLVWDVRKASISEFMQPHEIVRLGSAGVPDALRVQLDELWCEVHVEEKRGRHDVRVVGSPNSDPALPHAEVIVAMTAPNEVVGYGAIVSNEDIRDTERELRGIPSRGAPADPGVAIAELTIHRMWRQKTALTLELCRGLFECALDRGVRFVYLDASPYQRSYFERLGWREHRGTIKHPVRGEVISLVLDVEGHEHLVRVRSPLAELHAAKGVRSQDVST